MGVMVLLDRRAIIQLPPLSVLNDKHVVPRLQRLPILHQCNNSPSLPLKKMRPHRKVNFGGLEFFHDSLELFGVNKRRRQILHDILHKCGCGQLFVLYESLILKLELEAKAMAMEGI